MTGGTPLHLAGLRKAYGPVQAVKGVSLDVAAGSIVSLIGPSGCGKTTTLRMIAGLERPDSGRIAAGNRVLAEGRRGLPPEARDLGMVFQSYALWPHMSVAENVAYGLRRRRWADARIRAKVADVLELVHMASLAARYPGQLSGGQQQRVALARAIAPEPSLLLFDEPLSNLDAVLREQMRFEIRDLQQRLGTTSVYVTHSQDEALALSDAVAVMQAGAVIQVGPPGEIYARPCNAFVAGFIGLANILPVQHTQHCAGRLLCTLTDGTALHVADAGAPTTITALCIRPADLRPADLPTGEDGPNRLAGTVRAVTFTGSLVDVFVDLPGGTALRMQALPPVTASPGAPITLSVAPDRIAALGEP